MIHLMDIARAVAEAVAPQGYRVFAEPPREADYAAPLIFLSLLPTAEETTEPSWSTWPTWSPGRSPGRPTTTLSPPWTAPCDLRCGFAGGRSCRPASPATWWRAWGTIK